MPLFKTSLFMRQINTIEIPVGDMIFDAIASGDPSNELAIFLHGFPQSSVCWESVMSELPANYFCVAYNQRGYSRNARFTDKDMYKINCVVEDVLGVANYFAADKFHLVGHDWGGAVAWATAIFHPEVLKSVVAVSTPHPLALQNSLKNRSSDQRGKSSYIQLFRQKGVAEEMLSENEFAGLRSIFTVSGYDLNDQGLSEHLSQYIALLSEPGALTGALNWYRAINMNDTSVFPNSEALIIDTPVLYVWSDNDIALGKEAAFDTGNYLSGYYKFEVLKGISHWIPEMASRKLSELILSHWNTVGSI